MIYDNKRYDDLCDIVHTTQIKTESFLCNTFWGYLGINVQLSKGH